MVEELIREYDAGMLDRQSTALLASMADFHDLGRFSPDLRQRLAAALAAAIRSGEVTSGEVASGDAPIAAFDADGTLWTNDVSDDLLEWVDEHVGLTPPPGSASLKAHCDGLYGVDRLEGYRWSAAAYAGCALTDVSQWSAASFAARGTHGVNPEMRALVQWLLRHGVQVYIVSASPVWAVLPGARLLGLADEAVIAIDVDRQTDASGQTRLTSRVQSPITAGDGKVTRLLAQTGRPPFLASGNTIDDLPLMRSATQLAFAIDPRAAHGKSADLAALALAEGLPIHRTEFSTHGA
jgi:phosphatidylglycerophosphatase C